MKISMTGIALVLGAALLPVSATGQIPPQENQVRDQFNSPFDQQLNGRIDLQAEERAFEQSQTYARCVSKVGRDRAEELLDLPPGSNAERRALKKMSTRFRGCTSFRSSMPVAFLRGSLSEIFYEDVKPETVPTMVSSFDSERFDAFLKTQEASLKDQSKDSKALREAYLCLAMAAPGLTEKVMQSQHGKAEEKLAFRRLFTMAPGCAGSVWPEQISHAMQRSFAAEALYHWSLFENGNG